MRDFAFEASFPTSEFCSFMTCVNNNRLCFSLFRFFTTRDCHCSFCGEEVVGLEELGTATRISEMLAGGVLGAAANFEAAFGMVCSL